MLTSTKTSIGQILARLRSPLYLNGYALLVSSAATAGIGVLYWVVAARLYTPESVGLNSATLAVLMFITGLANLNLRGAMSRFIPRAGGATLRLVASAYAATLLAGLLFALIFVQGLGRWFPAHNFLSTDSRFMAGFVAIVLALCAFTLQDYVLVGLRKAIWVPLENILYAVAKLVLLVLMAASFPAQGIYLSYTLPVLLAIIPITYGLFRHWIPGHMAAGAASAEPIVPVTVVRYVAGDYLGSLFSLMSTTLVPILVTYRLGAGENAYFYLPWLIIGALDLVPVNLSLSLTVEGAHNRERLFELAKRILSHVLLLMVGAALFVHMFADTLLQAFGATYAKEGESLLRLLAWSSIPNALLVLYMSVERVRNNIARIVLVQFGACFSFLALGYTLLPTFGIEGVGWARLVGYGLIVVVISPLFLRPAVHRLLKWRGR